jgi:hypothetical protein
MSHLTPPLLDASRKVMACAIDVGVFGVALQHSMKVDAQKYKFSTFLVWHKLP